MSLRSPFKTLYKLTIPHYLIITIISPFLFSILLQVNLQQTVSTIITLSLLMLGLNAYNQVTDVETDKINKPKRPIPNGEISPLKATVIAGIFFLIALITGFFLGANIFALVLAYLCCVFIYSTPPLNLKKILFGSNIFGTVFHFLIPFLMIFSLSAEKFPIYIFLFLGALTFLVATYKDFEDVEGDTANNIKTIPSQFGNEKTFQYIERGIYSISVLFALVMIIERTAYTAISAIAVILIHWTLISRYFNSTKITKATTQAPIVTRGLIFLMISEAVLCTHLIWTTVI